MLRDVLSQTDLAAAPTVALLVFFSFFVFMTAWTFRRNRKDNFERMLELPFDDGSVEASDE